MFHLHAECADYVLDTDEGKRVSCFWTNLLSSQPAHTVVQRKLEGLPYVRHRCVGHTVAVERNRLYTARDAVVARVFKGHSGRHEYGYCDIIVEELRLRPSGGCHFSSPHHEGLGSVPVDSYPKVRLRKPCMCLCIEAHEGELIRRVLSVSVLAPEDYILRD